MGPHYDITSVELFLIPNVSKIIVLDLVHCLLKNQLFFYKFLKKTFDEIKMFKLDLIVHLN